MVVVVFFRLVVVVFFYTLLFSFNKGVLNAPLKSSSFSPFFFFFVEERTNFFVGVQKEAKKTCSELCSE